MYYLNEEQIALIRQEVQNQDIYLTHLADDMIDHLCCEIEEEIWNGANFDTAYKKVIYKIENNELQTVQNETLYLTDKNYRIMKKSMKIIGVASMALAAFGAMFKVQHYPGASILLLLGFITLAFVFVPAALYATWKESTMKGKKLLNLTGTASGILLILGILFKIQHWPGANILLTSGYNFICLIFLPAYTVSKLREKEATFSKGLYILSSASLIFTMEGCLFKIMHWPGASVLLIFGTILLTTVCLPMFYNKSFKQATHVKSSFIMICIGIILFNSFSLLLAMNISKNVLEDYIKPGENIMVSTRCIIAKNKELINLISKDSVLNSSKYKDVLSNIQIKSENAISAIREAKMKLFTMCSGENISQNNIDLFSGKNLRIPDNFDFANQIIIAEGMGEKIKSSIDEFRKFLIAITPEKSNNTMTILKLLDTSDPPPINGELEKWTEKFIHIPSIATFNMLSLTQRNIEMAELEALEYLLSQSSIPSKK